MGWGWYPLLEKLRKTFLLGVGWVDIGIEGIVVRNPPDPNGFDHQSAVKLQGGEAPLQACMAWGDTPEETLKSLLAVAQSIIQLRKERGIPLPPEIFPQRTGKGSLTVTA